MKQHSPRDSVPGAVLYMEPLSPCSKKQKAFRQKIKNVLTNLIFRNTVSSVDFVTVKHTDRVRMMQKPIEMFRGSNMTPDEGKYLWGGYYASLFAVLVSSLRIISLF